MGSRKKNKEFRMSSTNGNSKNVIGSDSEFNMSYCKILVTTEQLSKLLEFCYNDLATIKSITGCTCQVSENGIFFPGTQDRVMAVSGTLVQICVAIQLLSEVFRICASAERLRISSSSLDYGLIGMRLIVPNSVVGMIMGKAGQDIRTLAIDNSVRIQISKRIPGILERMVSIGGRSDHVCNASFVIIKTIQADNHTSEHATILTYPTIPSSPSTTSISSSSMSSSTASTSEDHLEAMTRSLGELVTQLSKYPRLLAEIRNA